MFVFPRVGFNTWSALFSCVNSHWCPLPRSTGSLRITKWRSFPSTTTSKPEYFCSEELPLIWLPWVSGFVCSLVCSEWWWTHEFKPIGFVCSSVHWNSLWLTLCHVWPVGTSSGELTRLRLGYLVWQNVPSSPGTFPAPELKSTISYGALDSFRETL